LILTNVAKLQEFKKMSRKMSTMFNLEKTVDDYEKLISKLVKLGEETA
jgi:hypothetical protein